MTPPEHVGLYVPDELVRHQVRLLADLLDELLDVAEVVVARGLHQLRDVEQHGVGRVRREDAHSVLRRQRRRFVSAVFPSPNSTFNGILQRRATLTANQKRKRTRV